MGCENCSGCASSSGCAGCSGCGGNAAGPLTEREMALLAELAENAFLPVARLLIRSTEDPELSFVMSAPVYLSRVDGDMEEVRAWGNALLSLWRRGAVTLDYGVPLEGFDYAAWEQSDYYQRFAFSVEAPGTAPYLERGSAAPTALGQELMDEL